MSIPHLPNEDGNQSEANLARTLSDTSICRAKRSGFGDYVDCLADARYNCAHGLACHGDYFCRHPEREKIIARTESAKAEVSSVAESLDQLLLHSKVLMG